jgi:hypothetical protein
MKGQQLVLIASKAYKSRGVQVIVAIVHRFQRRSRAFIPFSDVA